MSRLRLLGCQAHGRGYFMLNMTSELEQPFCMVYRGFDPVLAGMLQRMLEAEGIECRHLGTHYPAEIGVGALGCEQRLEVPEEDEARARELIEAATTESA